jgi:integrase
MPSGEAKRTFSTAIHRVAERVSLLVNATSQDGSPRVEAQNVVNRYFKPLLRRARLPNIRLHGLRHTCATLLARENVNPKVVQDTLGHANLNMTLGVYSYMQAAMKEEAALTVDGLFSD